MSINWKKPIEWSTGERTQVLYDDRISMTVDACAAWRATADEGIVGVDANTGKILGCEEEDLPFIQNRGPKLTDREITYCEAAMCMWENALALFEKPGQWADYVENVGYAQARMDVLEHVAQLQADYEEVADEYDRCFDWDFVPDWMVTQLTIHPRKGMVREQAPTGDNYHWRLLEMEVGDVLYDKQFGSETELQAEHFQRDRWNEFYCMGEPRVTSSLFKLVNNDWQLVSTVGA